MIMSGLQNIDFSGMAGLSGTLDRAAAEQRVYDLAHAGDKSTLGWQTASARGFGFFTKLINGVYDAGYVLTDDASATGRVGSTELRPVVVGAIGNFSVTGGDTISPKQIDDLLKGLDALPNVGVYVVSSGAAPQPQQQNAPVNQWSQAEQISRAAATPGANVSTWTQPKIFFNPTPQRPLVTTRYQKQPYKQTEAERQRLMWIIGGFGVVFAMAIGVIAARD